jgi:transposase
MDIRVPRMRKEAYERLEPEAREWVDSMTTLVEHLLVRIDSLEAKLAKNSRNSSKPPSSDGLNKTPRTQSNRTPSGKKPGGQSGHGGASLSQIKNPDQIVRHGVSSCCGCGCSLESVKASGIEKRQVFDLPPLNLTVTEHQADWKRCRCGQLTTAAFPASVTAPVQYGPEVQSLVVYLNTYQFVPFARLKEFFWDLFGVKLSPATAKRMLEATSNQTAITAEMIKNAVIRSALAHFDETGMRVAGTLHWLHSSSTERLTYYGVSQYRGQKAMEEIGILSQFKGKAVHDAWSPYYRFVDCLHFLCNAHHLRELKFVFEEHAEKWAGRMHSLLLKIHLVVFNHRADGEEGLSAYRLKIFEEKYNQIITAGKKLHGHRGELERTGSRGRKKQRKGKNLLDRLDRNRDQVLGFMRDFTVPFTNNLAERDIRMQKVKEKISGCFRTRAGADVFAQLRTYISTARKQGHRVLAAIRLAVIGQPLSLVAGT